MAAQKNGFHGCAIEDQYYGQRLIKIVQVEKNGAIHTIKEYQMELHLSLADAKEFMSADNSDIVCGDGCKNAIYILANNHGIKSPEEFCALVCNHFLSSYDHMMMVRLTCEEFSWNRISYDDALQDGNETPQLHNHAFIHAPECTRTCSVTLNRKDMKPSIKSGLRDLRLVKTDKASFLGYRTDAYRVLPDKHEKVLSTNASCTWSYKDDVTDIDYNNVWKCARNCIIKSWGGDAVEGVLATCIQFVCQSAGRKVLDTIPEIAAIEVTTPNLLYADFDFSQFSTLTAKNEKRKIYVPVEKPTGLACAKMVRK